MERSADARPARGATQSRDLRTGEPVWLDPPGHGVRGGAAPRRMRVEVAVIGGGVTGALVADALLQAGKQVAVFDRRGFVLGSTPASTALLQFEIDQPLTLLSRRIGKEKASRAWWRSATGVQALRGRIEDLRLDCDFRAREAAYLPGNVLDVAGLKAEAEARARIGLRSAFIGREELRQRTGLRKAGAIWSSGNAEVDPVKLARGLWRSARARGAMLHAPVDVVDIEPGRRGVTLTTAEGAEIRAGAVVLATGYELARMLHPKGYSIISSWAIATRPQARALWPSRCLIWEAADPYLYIRTTADGRALIGGEDAAFEDEAKRDALIPAKVKRLEAKAKALLPGVDTKADFAWAGCFGQSATGLPAIGRVPGAPSCYAVMGFGGNGITFAAIAAQMMQRMVLGLRDPDEDLFAV
ncbi:FAD-binding oxidoreductase [Roseomonas sp. AR75]|uniref:NAD(P)/FAD-dependent oxidoreductase n=1 Tax=Roseomonas sp. AR75 TaxID=2562311 RepID=UPI0010C0C9DB|nr:FAD-dependent oxidoreductase [Roseomonas sp. AR75]